MAERVKGIEAIEARRDLPRLERELDPAMRDCGRPSGRNKSATLRPTISASLIPVPSSGLAYPGKPRPGQEFWNGRREPIRSPRPGKFDSTYGRSP